MPPSDDSFYFINVAMANGRGMQRFIFLNISKREAGTMNVSVMVIDERA